MRLLGAFILVAALFLGGNALAAGTERINLRGDFIQGGLVFGQTEPGTELTFAGKPVRLTGRGEFVFGFHRDDPGVMQLEAVFPDGSRETLPLAVQQRTYKIQRIDGLDDKKVSPPESLLKRIRAEGARVRAARKSDRAESWFLETFVWPAKGRISGVYGSQRILNGKPRQPHYGIDVAAPVGTPVVAPASGIIILAEEDLYYSGGTILLDHGHGLASAFLHMEDIDVKVGQFIRQGERIGTIGATGRATGPHLDWRMNWFEKRVDPALLVPEMTATN